jgi:hypothetical protein
MLSVIIHQHIFIRVDDVIHGTLLDPLVILVF